MLATPAVLSQGMARSVVVTPFSRKQEGSPLLVIALIKNKAQRLWYFLTSSLCVIVSFLYFFHITQAYNLSRDHKPELEAERERIQSAGGYIQMGRVNGTLNLSRAIGILFFFFLLASFCSYLSP